MRITVKPKGDKTTISFEGSLNMKQEVIISRDDAQQLRELLQAEDGGLFETD